MSQSLLINSFISVDLRSTSEDALSYTLKSEYWHPPESDFILCRDKNGKATAVYGQNVWDFRPYNMSTTSSGIIDFNIFNNRVLTPHQVKLINELKELTFLCIYQKHSNKHSSIKTLLSKFHCLKKLTFYCHSSEFKRSLLDVLSNKILFSHFLQNQNHYGKQIISSLVFSLKTSHSDILKSELVDFIHKRRKNKQTPVIPSRIYFETFQRLTKEVDKFYKIKDKLKELIKEFDQPGKGLSLDSYTNEKAHSSISYLIKFHGLDDFFVGPYSVTQKQNLLYIIGNIQSTCAYLIYLYTGMRKEELLNCSFNCTVNYDLTPLDVKKHSSDLSKFINIISITTKFSGYRKEVGWLAPKKVLIAVNVLQAITEGTAFLFNTLPDKLPLFHSTQKILSSKAKFGLVRKEISKKPICLEDLIITNADKEELINTDPHRSFHERQFKVGAKWHFACHQFRRSLAFYGANSNLVSESTGAVLFKHLNNEMQRYYRKGFERIKCLLGYTNKDTGEIEIPSEHFLFEFQTGMSMEQAREIIHSLVPKKASKRKLFLGKRGKALSRNLLSKNPNNFNIIKIRDETEKSVINGEIAYKKTLLGGCMKIGKCDDFMLGNFTQCLSCEEAIIDPSKLTDQIRKSETELKAYPTNTAEHQLIKKELKLLLNLHTTRNIK